MMDLICYLHPGWAPLIRPAPASRPWMDDTPESFAYRCLPLNIANAHGWEILSPCGFEASWNGATDTSGVTIHLDAGAEPTRGPVSLFGQGIVTFHIEGLFRTPPGWNLWVGGAPNRPKDAIQPLSGVVETDWSPFTFTMNWRFTRTGQSIRFEAFEPIGFIFPIERAAVESFTPRFEPIANDPQALEGFTAWSQARDAFHQRMLREPPATPADKWQKHYYRGVDVTGRALVEDHRSKLRLATFDTGATPQVPVAPPKDGPAQTIAPATAHSINSVAAGRAARDLAKREWLLEAMERQRALAPRAVAIERRAGLGGQEFLETYYAPGRPVILTGEMAGWPALTRWTPDYLKRTVGSRPVAFQDARNGSGDFERAKDAHRIEAPFDVFMDRISRPGAGNDAYLTAYNSGANADALAPLWPDLGFLDKFLTRPPAGSPGSAGMMWIGPEGTFTPLHHDLTNNFIAQIVGRKRIKLAPASEVGRLYNDAYVFSEIQDLDDPRLDRARFGRLEGARLYDLVLEPGDILFMPLAWWHQVKSLEFSVTATFTNFLWPNDASATYPPEFADI
jgi:hypothetical protein